MLFVDAAWIFHHSRQPLTTAQIASAIAAYTNVTKNISPGKESDLSSPESTRKKNERRNVLMRKRFEASD